MSKIEKLYGQPDKFFIVNDNDPDLFPIKIPLPELTLPLNEIDGYGLHPSDQIFQYTKYPDRLRKLERSVLEDLQEAETRDKNATATGQKFLKEIWNVLLLNRKEYREELRFIDREWRRRLNGYWCFIDGIPTHIDGWHYMFLNYFNLDIGKAEYRDRDRRWFLAQRFFYNDTTTFKKLTKEGLAIPEKDGSYEMIDLFIRLIIGSIPIKGRRMGDTFKVLLIMLEIITRTPRADGGIQGYNQDSGEKHYHKKLIPAWKELPFFFKPMWKGSSEPQKKLVFGTPASMSFEDSLGSSIVYATSGGELFYDGDKLYFYDCEEPGKTSTIDLQSRWNIVKPTLYLGDTIHGFSVWPTTVEDIDDGGSKPFFNMLENSKYNQRLPNGQTMSGLVVNFWPAYDGREGFIGKFGESIIEPATPSQAEWIKKNRMSSKVLIGAKKAIQEHKDFLLSLDTPESREEYYSYCRKFPTEFKEIYYVPGGAMDFPHEIIDKRMAELRRMDEKEYCRRGNFVWKNGRKDTEVDFVDDPQGRFNVYHMPKEDMRNLKCRRNTIWGESWAPLYPDKYTSSSDPYAYRTKAETKLTENKSRLSDGGGMIFQERDKLLDPDTKNIKDWITHNIAADYLERPDSNDDFAEDMLMASVFFGAMMFTERNIDLIIKHFIQRKYGAYLKYEFDKYGVLKSEPGVYSLRESKDRMAKAIRYYLITHGHRCMSYRFLDQCRRIRYLEEMTKYDLFAACGLVLLGSESDYSKLFMPPTETRHKRELFKKRRYC
uniref:Uncharacterized protein n=1 Tax=viral metagenome TaxID=1070528 RepID=A0A6M3KNW4_9ZZZZ